MTDGTDTDPTRPEGPVTVDLAKQSPEPDRGAPHPAGPTAEPEEPGEPASGWHPVNLTHLVLGAAFVGLAIVWAVLARDDVSLDDARWLLPLPWLVGGGLGLLATVARGSRRQRP